jgi:GTPase SAR1 family protein
MEPTKIELQPGELTVVIVGLPGAGKTTIATQLANDYPEYKLFNTDKYIQEGFKDDLQAIMYDALFDPAERKIIEGVQCYRLLRQGLERKFFPHVVINVLATQEVRAARRPGKSYKDMDAMLRTIWIQYNRMSNGNPPRLVELLNE